MITSTNNQIISTYSQPNESMWVAIMKRPTLNLTTLNQKVETIFEQVKTSGDQALLQFTASYDHVQLDSLSYPLADDILLESTLKDAIDIAYRNIYAFHNIQKQSIKDFETSPGVFCSQRMVPIERVGIYIPGGSAPLFSTVLMLGIPALIAGCREVVLCSPPNKDGQLHPAIVYAAKLCGVTHAFTVGGAQAIAAMCLGTESIPKVDKIFGPGNQYVTAAKMQASKYHTAIDMPAGPSEVLVFADETGIPSFIAADLLAQAEHGADSQVIAVVPSEKMALEISDQISHQLAVLPRASIAAEALKNSSIIVEENAETAFTYINHYAPEHLIIASERPKDYLTMIKNAGSVFLGNWTPESGGDYATGTNHTLPTDGWARSYSGVNLDAFCKKITFQEMTPKGINNLGPAIMTMAQAESLQAHAEAVNIRLQALQNKES